jgi:tryptophan 2,3-dioxygenase
MPEQNIRPLEEGIERDLRGLNYASYLHLDELLGAQQPLSDHHDEMLFVIVHHTTELWIKLVIHEVRSAMALIAADQLAPALKRLARVKHVQRQMTDQWSVLATLTPTEYSQFRDRLGKSSGFQSAQYRTLEFLLGNKNPAMIAVFAHDSAVAKDLENTLHSPSLYDEFLLYLGRRGYPIPADLLDRDWSKPHTLNTDLVRIFTGVYDDPEHQWDVYETCEELVDIEDTFQTWRFRHLKTVERIIGYKRGTGGSTGVAFLTRALSLTFFPELFAVRTEIGQTPENPKGSQE